MSTQYPGLPAVALRYWKRYMIATLGMAVTVLFAGAAGAVVVFALVPDAKWYLAFAVGALILHSAALYLRDLRHGEYDPSQTTFSSPIEILALFVLLGVLESTLLLIGTGLGYGLDNAFGAPFILAAIIGAYYPVVDVLLMRRGWKTPGVAVMIAVALLMSTVIDIHISISKALPIIGTRRRPQS